jgi:Tol biopolymer transport system component
VVYTSNRTGNYNVYAADYDGTNEKLLSDNKGNNTSPELLSDGNSVMFLSTRDGYKDAYNQPIAAVYRVNIDGSSLTKITKTQYEDLGSIGIYNFQAGKRAYTKYNYDAGGEQQIFFGNIDGTDMQMIFSNSGFDGYVRNLLIAPSRTFLIADLIDSKDGSPQCFLARINAQSGARNDIISLSAYSYASLLSVSPDSSSFLLITSGLDDNNENIFKIGVNDGKVTKITNNSIAELTAFYTPDQSQIIYYDVRDNKTDLFKSNAQGGSEVRLTTAGRVEQVIQTTGSLIFYIENSKLMVMDSNYPGIAKLVTENVSVYFPQWY